MNTKLGFVSALTLAAMGLMASPAHAGIDACGDIHVESSAMCEFEAEAECQGHCEEPQVDLACRGQLSIECEGECTAEFDASCTAECNIGACEASCDVDPGKFDCSAQCSANAEGNCNAQCGTDEKCMASCKGAVSAECDSRCDVEPAQVDCQAKCEASCRASCQAEANIDCNVRCQNNSFVECQGELSAKCEGQCDADGALFCDGQYVDHGGNAQECVDALEAVITSNVEGYAHGSAECSGGSCEAEGEAGCSARMAPEVPRGGAAAILAGFGIALALGARRRRSL
jgi:hypothetical protein